MVQVSREFGVFDAATVATPENLGTAELHGWRLG